MKKNTNVNKIIIYTGANGLAPFFLKIYEKKKI